MTDVAIIGTGPAGLSAAITLKMRGKSVLWFGSKDFSPKVEKSSKIGNYPGLGMISGKELNTKFAEHAEEMGLEITEKTVTLISPMGDHFMLLADNEPYEAASILLTTGVVQAKGFPGEEELLGRGVSYCATCDGMFYKGKTIGVFCGTERYEHEVEYLAEMAEKVYMYPAYKDCKLDLPNVEFLGSPIKEVLGETHVEGFNLYDGRRIEADGLFILRNAIAPGTLLPGLETSGAHIVTDRSLATNIPGCFAAGDCTGAPYQIAKAVGEGNIAAHSILEFLAK